MHACKQRKEIAVVSTLTGQQRQAWRHMLQGQQLTIPPALQLPMRASGEQPVSCQGGDATAIKLENLQLLHRSGCRHQRLVILQQAPAFMLAQSYLANM